jgi:hypothetical protein
MKNVLEIMKEFGLEVPDDKKGEFNKQIAENYKTIAEHTKVTGKLESERDDYKTKFETADTTLKGFEGVNVEDLQAEVKKYKEVADTAQKDYESKIYERDFNDTLKDLIDNPESGYKFTSQAARQSVLNEVKSAGLKLTDGKIMGLNDLMNSIKEKDSSAFVNDAEEKAKEGAAKFTNPIKTGNKEITKEQFNKMGYLQRLELKKNNPESYEQLKGNE